MTAPRSSSVRFPVEPRDIPEAKAARRLGMTEAEFGEVRERLFARGFPKPDPDTGRFDLKAIDLWMDRRSGLLTSAESGRQSASPLRERLQAWEAP